MAEKLIKRRWSMPLPSSDDGTPPSEFRIFAAGLNQSEQGPCVFDELAAESVMAQYALHGKATHLDYNHGTEFPFPDPEMAVAAGEFIPEVRAGELWATAIKWTDRAGDYIRKREYRYFSPCFQIDGESLRVMRIISVALTNRPAMDNIPALIAASANGKDDTMTPEEIKKLQDRNEALEAENKTLRAGTAHVVALSAALGAKGDEPAHVQLSSVQGLVTFRADVLRETGKDSAPAALGLISAWKAKAAQADELVAKDARREEEAVTVRLNAALDAAIKELKLPPAQREFELRAALAFGGGKVSDAGVEWLTAKYAASAPIVKGTSAGGGPPAGGAQPPSPGASKMNRLMSIDETAFAKFQAEQAARAGQ